MVPPRALSFGLAVSRRLGWPLGRVNRPPAATGGRPAWEMVLTEKEGFEPSRQGFPHLTP